MVGGLIGKQFGNGKDAITALGAIVRGSQGAKLKQESAITGYKEKRNRKTVYE